MYNVFYIYNDRKILRGGRTCSDSMWTIFHKIFSHFLAISQTWPELQLIHHHYSMKLMLTVTIIYWVSSGNRGWSRGKSDWREQRSRSAMVFTQRISRVFGSLRRSSLCFTFHPTKCLTTWSTISWSSCLSKLLRRGYEFLINNALNARI